MIQSCRKPRKVHIFDQNEANLDDSWPVESEYDGYEGYFSNDEGLVEEDKDLESETESGRCNLVTQ